MLARFYVVTLTENEQNQLRGIVQTGGEKAFRCWITRGGGSGADLVGLLPSDEGDIGVDTATAG